MGFFETRAHGEGFHLHTTPMNLNSLFPVVLSLLLTIAALVQAAPEKGSRRDLPRQGATAFDREDYLKNHPELKEGLDKIKDMSPEERREWFKAHPELAEKIEKFKEGGKEGGKNAGRRAAPISSRTIPNSRNTSRS